MLDHTKFRRMRVLMTADAVGGVWSYCLDLTRELAKHEIQVLLAVTGPEPSHAQREEVSSIPNVRMVHRPYALEWFHTFTDLQYDKSGKWLMKLAADFHPDVVHVNGFAHANLDWKTPVLVVAHSCVYSWFRAVHEKEPDPDYAPYRERVIAGLQAATAVVAPSEWMLGALRQTYGLPVMNAAAISNFSSLPANPAKKEPFIFASGRLWDKAKNLRVLDGIASDLKWPILVAGDPHGPEGTNEACHGLHLLGKVTRTEVADHMGRASIFAHPAKYEPFGLVVLEAARSGCALVLADIPSLRELWDGVALFVPPDRPQDWQEALTRLAESESERASLASAALERSHEFKPEHSVQQYMNLYEGLKGRRAVPPTKTKRNESSNQTLLPLHRF